MGTLLMRGLGLKKKMSKMIPKLVSGVMMEERWGAQEEKEFSCEEADGKLSPKQMEFRASQAWEVISVEMPV